MADDSPRGAPAGAGEEELELLEAPIVAPPEKLRKFLTRPRMFLGFALSVMVTVLITRLFSLHLRHNFGVVRGHAHEPEFLIYAVLAVLVYMSADTVSLVLLTRVLKSTVRLKPLVLLSLRANFVGGTTSFGGVEIPYQIFALRRQGLTLPEATSVILVKGVVHTSVLVLVALTAVVVALTAVSAVVAGNTALKLSAQKAALKFNVSTLTAKAGTVTITMSADESGTDAEISASFSRLCTSRIVSCSPSAARSVQTTRPPIAAMRRAVWRPMPDAAPVTR